MREVTQEMLKNLSTSDYRLYLRTGILNLPIVESVLEKEIIPEIVMIEEEPAVETIDETVVDIVVEEEPAVDIKEEIVVIEPVVEAIDEIVADVVVEPVVKVKKTKSKE